MDAPFWDKERTRWLLMAAEYTGYYKKLARLMTPRLFGSVCDMGCGLGCLSIELVPSLLSIDALDADPAAIESLLQRAPVGVHPRLADAMALGDEDAWDCIILNFFGRITRADNLSYFLSHCKRLIFVAGGAPVSCFSATGISARKKECVPEVAMFLKKAGVPFSLEEHTIEFGQPLSGLDDARAFVKRFSPPEADIPDDPVLLSRLTPLPGGRYYLPNPKRIGIFTIEKEKRYADLTK